MKKDKITSLVGIFNMVVMIGILIMWSIKIINTEEMTIALSVVGTAMISLLSVFTADSKNKEE